MKGIARTNDISSKKCAFCKNWYDPTNSAIKLKATITWEYDMGMKCMCRIKKIYKKGFQTCSKFESKI